MGYSITIGNAFCQDDLTFDVDEVESSLAPAFPHDDLSNHRNARHPSYSAWTDFVNEVGLYDLFLGFDGLLRSHPGIEPLTKEHLAVIQTALERWQVKATLPPGFAGDPKPTPSGQWVSEDAGKYDHQLARLIWLEWWVRWALENCERPAIRNT